jgi:hypothetical protein
MESVVRGCASDARGFSVKPIQNMLAVPTSTLRTGAGSIQVSEFPRRGAVSADPIVAGEAVSCANGTTSLNPGVPVLVSRPAARAVTQRDERLLGALGLTVIAFILALGVYLVAKYLF